MSNEETVLYDGVDYEINASNLFFIFKNEYSFRFTNSRVPKFSMKTGKLFRELIDEQGAKKSVEIILWAMKNWRYLQMEYKIASMPTVPLVYGYRHTIMGLIDSPIKKNAVSYDNKNGQNKRSNKNTLLYRK